jgi:hypothetical protein
VASSKFELILVLSNSKHVNISRCIFVKRHRLKQNILGIFSWFRYVDKFIQIIFSFENIGVTLFAYLTLKFFPIVTGNIFSVLFGMSLGFYPIFKTKKVNETNWTSAFTSKN